MTAAVAEVVVVMCLGVVARANQRAVACWEELDEVLGVAMKLHDHSGELLASEKRRDGDHTVHLAIRHAPVGLWRHMMLDNPDSDTEEGLGEDSDGHLAVNSSGCG